MPPPKNAARLAYVLFAVGTFVLSMYWTFPARVVTMRVAQEVAKATQGRVRIKVGRADLWRLSGVAARDVRLQVGDDPEILMDAARVRLRLLPLLLGRGSIYAQVQLDRGLAEVIYGLGSLADADIKLDAVDLSHPPWLAKHLGIPLQGVLTGTASITDAGNWRAAKGQMALTMDKVSFGPASVMGLGLPQVGLGKIQLDAELSEGQARLTSFRQQGGNVALDARGRVLLSEPVMGSQLDVCAKLRVEPAFLQANPKLASVVQLAEVQLKRDSNGFLNVPLAGQLGAPQLKPGLCPNR